ncbi:MAG: glycosyltransferase [archaeon]
MISIVIPAYNEEKYLPHLLESLRKQTYKDYEIIVADRSSDMTGKIAKKYGCKLVSGGTPAAARNNGAKAARYDLLFLDADVILNNSEFLGKFLDEIKRKNLDVACCKVNIISTNILHRLFYAMKNFNNKYFGYIFPFMSGQCIFVKKKIFRELRGFDASLELAEEHDFQARAKKVGKFHFFNNYSVLSFPRRIQLEGFFKLCLKNTYSDLLRIIFGNKKRVDYEFGKF